jgi:magnesium-transporting ATPase (P-type)
LHADETQILRVKVERGRSPPSRARVTGDSTELIFQRLGSSPNGLTSSEASGRLARFGANRLKGKSRAASLTLLLGQFKSPIVLILIGAAILSIFLQDASDAAIILAIVLVSGLLGFWQEHGAANAVAKLRAVVETKVHVLRDGAEVIAEQRTVSSRAIAREIIAPLLILPRPARKTKCHLIY